MCLAVTTLLLFEVLNTWMFTRAHLERTCPCQISWQQNPCRVCKAWGRTVSSHPPARSRKHDSGTAFWWRCPPGWHEPARLSPGGPGACAWHGAGVQIQWDRRGGSERSACCPNCRGHREPGAAAGISYSLRNDWPSCSASAFLCSKSWSTSGKKLESRTLGKFLQIKKRKKERPKYTLFALNQSDVNLSWIHLRMGEYLSWKCLTAEAPDAVGKLRIKEGGGELTHTLNTVDTNTVSWHYFCCIIRNALSPAPLKKEIITSVSELWQDVSQLFHC